MFSIPFAIRYFKYCSATVRARFRPQPQAALPERADEAHNADRNASGTDEHRTDTPRRPLPRRKVPLYRPITPPK